MKKIILTLALFCFFVTGYSQSDTLYTKKQQKIPCKIVEIGESDFRYTLADLPDGPVYVISRANILKYRLSNGHTEMIIPDEMSIENEHSEILKNRRAIKIQPFSFANNQISLAYEKVIKVGMNLDVEVGYINNNINNDPLINSNNVFNNYYGYMPYYSNYYYTPERTFYSGAYVKPGVKFFLGQDYSIKGMKYAHPLKGRYIKLDLAFSYLNFRDIKRVEFVQGPFPAPPTTTTITTNVGSFSYGGFVNYGRQFILANVLTFEYYIGIGYTGQSNSYSNAAFLAPSGFNRMEDPAKRVSNYHGFQRISNGLSGTAGFRIGYILPDKCTRSKEKVK